MFDIQSYPELTHYLITHSAQDILRPPPANPVEGEFYFANGFMQQWRGGQWVPHDTEWRFLPKAEFQPIGKAYPSQAEMNTWLSQQSEPILDKFIYLNGTDDPKAGVQTVWYVNFAGWADEIRRGNTNGGIQPSPVPTPSSGIAPSPSPAIQTLPPCVITAVDSETGLPVYLNGMPSAILYDKSELAVIDVPPGKMIDGIDDPAGLVANIVNKHTGIVNLSYDLKIDRAVLKVCFKTALPRPIAQNGLVGVGKAKHRLSIKFPRPFPAEGGTLTVNVTAQYNHDARLNPECEERFVALENPPTHDGFGIRFKGMNALDSFHWQALWLPTD